MKQFTFTWDDYLVGFIVHNNDTGEEANMQFDPMQPLKEFLFGVEGDNSYENFTEEEQELAYEEAQDNEELMRVEDNLRDIYREYSTKKAFERLYIHGAKNHGVSIDDIANILVEEENYERDMDNAHFYYLLIGEDKFSTIISDNVAKLHSELTACGVDIDAVDIVEATVEGTKQVDRTGRTFIPLHVIKSYM